MLVGVWGRAMCVTAAAARDVLWRAAASRCECAAGRGARAGWRNRLAASAHGCWNARACVFGRRRRPQR